MFQFGDKAKDTITGITGIITGRASYITGCDQYLIQPESKDNEWKEGRWFDEGRIQIIESQALKPHSVQMHNNGADMPAPKK